MSETKHTPEERAVIALTSSHTFCNLLAEARRFKFPGWWDGSSFRRHPCGVIEGVIKLTNHWHVDNHCDVQITDGDGWDRSVSQDSFGYDSPHPKPIGGAAVTVWQSGRWRDGGFQEHLEPKLLNLLTRIARHVHDAEERERVAQEEANAKRVADRRALELAAIRKATGEQP